MERQTVQRETAIVGGFVIDSEGLKRRQLLSQLRRKANLSHSEKEERRRRRRRRRKSKREREREERRRRRKALSLIKKRDNPLKRR